MKGVTDMFDLTSPHRFVISPASPQIIWHMYRDPDSESGNKYTIDAFGLRTIRDAVLAHEEVHKIYNDLTIDGVQDVSDVDSVTYQRYNTAFEQAPALGVYEDKDTLLRIAKYYLDLFPNHPYAIQLMQNVQNCVEYASF